MADKYELPDLGSAYAEKNKKRTLDYFSNQLSPLVEELKSYNSNEDLHFTRKGITYEPRDEDGNIDYTVKLNHKKLSAKKMFEDDTTLYGEVDKHGNAKVEASTSLFGGKALIRGYKAQNDSRGVQLEYRRSW